MTHTVEAESTAQNSSLSQLDPNVDHITPLEPRASVDKGLDEVSKPRIWSAEGKARAEWNSSVPANRLPNEIMVEVWLVLCEEHENGCTETVPPQMAWIHLMQVCRYWRDVATATPMLWSTITAWGDNVDWVNLCLTRSATTLLKLFLTYPSNDVLNLLPPQSCRITDLAIVEFTFPRSLSFLHEPMPILENLFLAAAHPDYGLNLFDFEMSPRNYPLLRYLEIESIPSLPRNVEMYAGLRKLTLNACSHNITLEQFFDILCACTCLESLSLTDFLARLPDRTWVKTTVPWRPLITLPLLATLAIKEERPRDISHVLAHLILSPTTKLEVHPILTPEEDDEITMCDVLPLNCEDTLPMLWGVTYVEIRMARNEYIIRASLDAAMPEHTVLFDVASQVDPHEREWERYILSHGLPDLLEIFYAASLTRISVSGDYDRAQDSEDWRAVFSVFPDLEELECLAGDGSTTDVWVGLGPDATTQEYHCLQLRSVTMHGCSIRDREQEASFFRAMTACLLSRAADGRRVRKLDLELRNLDKSQSDEELRQRYYEHLSDLVDEVRLRVYH